MQSNLSKRKCPDHNNKQVVFACYNKFCKEKRLVCQKCNVLHSAHLEELIDDDQIEEKVQHSQSKAKQLIKQLNDSYDELTQQFKKLIQSIETKFNISIVKMNGMDNQQFNCYFNQLIIQDEQQMNLSEIFSNSCQNFKVKIIQCQNDLGLKELNYVEIMKEDMEKAEVYFKQGQDYHSKYDYVNAIKQFDLALDLNRNHLESLHCKGESLMMLDQYKESIEWYDKALQIDPKYIYALRGKGASLSMLGQYKESIQLCNKALQIDSKYKQALYSKGEALRMLTQYTQALEFLESALQIDNNYEIALGSKGACLIALNRLDEAENCLNKAIKLNPSNTFNINQLKKLHNKRKQ